MGGIFLNIILVRHGQSVADIEGKYEGRASFPLTELGYNQAELAAKWLCENFNIELLYSSPLIRAAQTAEIIGKKLNLKVVFEDGLMELDNGLVSGLLREEANKKYPIPKGGFRPYEHFGKTGETLIVFRARVESFWCEFIDKREEDNTKCVCIVAHGNMISTLYKCFLNLPISSEVHFTTGDTGIHSWQIEKGVKNIIFSNYLEHLKVLK